MSCRRDYEVVLSVSQNYTFPDKICDLDFWFWYMFNQFLTFLVKKMCLTSLLLFILCLVKYMTCKCVCVCVWGVGGGLIWHEDTSAQCPCGEADQTPEHYLQSCSLHQQARQQIWPTCVSLKTKLWGSAEDLLLTSRYAALTGERI